MRYKIVILSCLLSGCAGSVWVGANPERDIYECKMEAARQYPPVLYSQQIGNGYKSPSYTSCNAVGNFASCTTTGGNYTPPTVITSDANESFRNNSINYCMVQRGNRLMSKSDYQSYKDEQSNEETPAQRKIRLREDCRIINGQNSPLCTDKSNSDYSHNETPIQRKIRLREKCRRENGQDSPLCIDKSNSNNSNNETIDKNKRAEREACIKTYGTKLC